MNTLEQRQEELSKQLLSLSVLRLKRASKHLAQMNKPRLSNLFLSLEKINERDDELLETFEREEAALQAAEDKLYEELADIERQLNPAG